MKYKVAQISAADLHNVTNSGRPIFALSHKSGINCFKYICIDLRFKVSSILISAANGDFIAGLSIVHWYHLKSANISNNF